MKAFFSRRLLLLLITAMGLAITADSWIIPWLAKIHHYYIRSSRSPMSAYVNLLSRKEKSYLQDHLRRATDHLQNPDDEREIAAAVNDYVYQMLLLRDNGGTPVSLLKEGYAICGGHALVAGALLEVAGIANHLAYLVNVPHHQGHVMVEAQFKDGKLGLYDPSFGVYWKRKGKGGLLSLNALKREPDLAVFCAHQSRHRKRSSAAEEIEPFVSTARDYRPLKPNQLAQEYRDMFGTIGNAGLRRLDHKIYNRVAIPTIPCEYGNPSTTHVPQSVATLGQSTNDAGQIHHWLHCLGKQNTGVNVAHIFQFRDLALHQRYRIQLSYVKSVDSVVCATVLGGQLADTTRQTDYRVVGSFVPKLIQKIPLDLELKRRTLSFRFIADSPEVSVILDNEGEMMLHYIRVEEDR